MSTAPPIIAEEAIVVAATAPIAANPIRDAEPVAVAPIAGPIAMVVTITLVSAPNIVPLLELAIHERPILRTAVARAINGIAIALVQETLNLIVGWSVRLELAGSLKISTGIRRAESPTVGIPAKRSIPVGRAATVTIG